MMKCGYITRDRTIVPDPSVAKALLPPVSLPFIVHKPSYGSAYSPGESMSSARVRESALPIHPQSTAWRLRRPTLTIRVWVHFSKQPGGWALSYFTQTRNLHGNFQFRNEFYCLLIHAFCYHALASIGKLRVTYLDIQQLSVRAQQSPIKGGMRPPTTTQSRSLRTRLAH